MIAFIAERPGASALRTNFAAKIAPISVVAPTAFMPDRMLFMGVLLRKK
jgi:hypothetical protein